MAPVSRASPGFWGAWMEGKIWGLGWRALGQRQPWNLWGLRASFKCGWQGMLDGCTKSKSLCSLSRRQARFWDSAVTGIPHHTPSAMFQIRLRNNAWARPVLKWWLETIIFSAISPHQGFWLGLHQLYRSSWEELMSSLYWVFLSMNMEYLPIYLVLWFFFIRAF